MAIKYVQYLLNQQTLLTDVLQLSHFVVQAGQSCKSLTLSLLRSPPVAHPSIFTLVLTHILFSAPCQMVYHFVSKR
jgi:hypothetical protein